MNKLFDFLYSGCWHHWEIYKEAKIIGRYETPTENSVPLYFEYTLRCKNCGEMKLWSTKRFWSY